MTLRHLSLGSLGAACSILALALACGGGGGKGSSTPAPAPATSLAGAWTGTGNNGSTNYVLVMPTDGSFSFLNSSAQGGFSGSFLLSGTNLSGSITLMGTAANAGTPISGTLGGTATTSSIDAKISSDNSTVNNTAFTLTPDAAAATGAQLSGLEGTWSSSTNTEGKLLTYTVDAAGNVSGTDSTGTVTGTLAQPTANANAFTAALVFTPTSGAAQNFKGTAYLRENSSQMIFTANNGTVFLGGVFARQ